MSRPVGSKNKPKTDAKQDGYANAFSGGGTSRDRSSHTFKSMPYLLDRMTMMALYLDGMGRRVVDVPCEEMTRAGIELEGLEETLEEKVMAKSEELDIMKHINDALIWSSVFGGSLVVLGLNDGGMLEMPVNPDGVQGLEFLRVYDRYQVTIENRNNDIMSQDYGKPELWLISPHHGGMPYKVHNSRVVVFDGESIPDYLRNTNDGWGVSVYQSCYNELKRLGSSHQWANSLLERAQQAIHGIPGLSTILKSPGGEAAMQQRVDVVDMVRGILNTIVIDGAETYDVKTSTFAGLPDLLDKFAEALAATRGIPVYLLMGTSQGGLSDTNAANLEGWYARVGAMQKDILKKPLDVIFGYIVRSIAGKDTDYTLCFNPLYVPSDKEKAETEKLDQEAKKSKAETEQIYVTMNALDPGEVRKNIAEEYDVSPAALPEPALPDDEAVLAGAVTP